MLPCQADNGEEMVLNLTPDLKIAADEATALDLWSASPHVVQLHDADLGRSALLLERVCPGTRLQDEPDRWPLADVAPMLTDLWPPAWIGAGSGLPDLRDRVEFVFDLTRLRLARHPAAARQIPPGLMEASQITAGASAGDVTAQLAGAFPGPDLAAARGQQAGNELRQFPGDIEHGTIGDHAEPLR